MAFFSGTAKRLSYYCSATLKRDFGERKFKCIGMVGSLW